MANWTVGVNSFIQIHVNESSGYRCQEPDLPKKKNFTTKIYDVIQKLLINVSSCYIVSFQTEIYHILVVAISHVHPLKILQLGVF